MEVYRPLVEQPRELLRGLHVARTVQRSQPAFEGFLSEFGARLERGVVFPGLCGAILEHSRAKIKPIGSTRLTFLESGNVAEYFASRDEGTNEVRKTRDELEQHLADTLPIGHTTVRVNERAPLRWVGRLGTLALNIEDDERLVRERAEIEKFLRERFGDLPRLYDFEPHITVGRVLEAIPYETWKEPVRIVPKDIVIPEEVVLNGLAVHLGSS